MAKGLGATYPGELGDRLPAPKKGEAPLPKTILPNMHQRLMLLFDHYGIEKPCGLGDGPRWERLALTLALVHVPGLQTAKRGGRPKTWGKRQKAKLFLDVTLRMRKGQSESQACYHLAAQNPWSAFIQSRSDDQRSKGLTLLRKFKEIQNDEDVTSLVAKIENRWPNEVDKYLMLASERLNF